jgi:hypothetical protein
MTPNRTSWSISEVSETPGVTISSLRGSPRPRMGRWHSSPGLGDPRINHQDAGSGSPRTENRDKHHTESSPRTAKREKHHNEVLREPETETNITMKFSENRKRETNITGKFSENRKQGAFGRFEVLREPRDAVFGRFRFSENLNRPKTLDRGSLRTEIAHQHPIEVLGELIHSASRLVRFSPASACTRAAASPSSPTATATTSSTSRSTRPRRSSATRRRCVPTSRRSPTHASDAHARAHAELSKCAPCAGLHRAVEVRSKAPGLR